MRLKLVSRESLGQWKSISTVVRDLTIASILTTVEIDSAVVRPIPIPIPIPIPTCFLCRCGLGSRCSVSQSDSDSAADSDKRLKQGDSDSDSDVGGGSDSASGGGYDSDPTVGRYAPRRAAPCRATPRLDII